jgi:hypothetical protein
MNVYSLISIIVFLLIVFGFYKLFNRNSKRSKNQQFLSEEDLKPFLGSINLDFEEKVRKQWLVSFFTLTGISALSIFFIIIKNELFKESADLMSIAFIIVFGSIVSSLPLIPWCWITYHCAYKKRGTAWLLWTTIWFLLRLIFLAIVAAAFDWSQAAEMNSLGWFMGITFLSTEIFYRVNSFRLLMVNSDRECQKVLALKAKYGRDADGFC